MNSVICSITFAVLIAATPLAAKTHSEFDRYFGDRWHGFGVGTMVYWRVTAPDWAGTPRILVYRETLIGISKTHYTIKREDRDGLLWSAKTVRERISGSRIEAIGHERIQVAGKRVNAEKRRITDAKGNSRIVWVEDGRVLAVKAPGVHLSRTKKVKSHDVGSYKLKCAELHSISGFKTRLLLSAAVPGGLVRFDMVTPVGQWRTQLIDLKVVKP